MRLVVAAVILGSMAGHLISGHNLHLRLAKLVRPSIHIPTTNHELKHQARPRDQRIVADLVWVVFLSVAVIFALG